MSLSKEQPRQPKCTRCRHHGLLVPQKGHTRLCPYINCDCHKCCLVTQRTRLTGLQRNLNRAQKKPEEKRPGASGEKPTADTAALTGGARAPESDANRSRPAARGERMTGLDSREVLPLASNVPKEGPYTPINAPYFGELGQSAPLPVIHFPFRMSGHYPSSFAPCQCFTMPWFPPVPAGPYNEGLHGPLAFPHFQQAAVHYPPPPEPGPPADSRQIFFTLQPPTLPEPLQEELMARQPPQPPLPKHAEPNVEEQQ